VTAKGFKILMAVIMTVLAASVYYFVQDDHDNGRYYSQEAGFSIRFPESWENKKSFMWTDVVSLSQSENADDGFRENVSVLVEKIKHGTGFDEYRKNFLDILKKNYSDLRIEEKSKTVIDGFTAERVLYTHSVDQFKVKVMVFIFVKGESGYVITCSAEPEKFVSYSDKFKDIVKSFRFE